MRKKVYKTRLTKWIVATLLVASIMVFSETGTVRAETSMPVGGLLNQVTFQEYDSLDELQDATGKISVKNKKTADAYWDKFSCSYFYTYMNASEQALYNHLYNVAYQTLATTTTLNNDATYGVVTAGAPYTGLTPAQAQNVAYIFSYENPQYYFLDSSLGVSYAGTSGVVYLGVYDTYQNGSARANDTALLKSKIDNHLAQINAESTMLAKEQKAHDIVVDITVYDDSTEEAVYAGQSCASVFLTGRSVCAGYSEAFALLCNGVGIPTISVTSAVHEWNQVNLNGYWYAVDATWNDTTDSRDYYNMSDASLRAGNSMHNTEDIWSIYKRPVCDYDYANTPSARYIYNGADYTAVFEPDYYAEHNIDVRNAYGYDTSKLLAHFVNYGMGEGRRGNSKFDLNSYKNRYADLRAAYGNNFKSYYLHYINYGIREGRSAVGCPNVIDATTTYHGTNYATVYDYNYYIARNPDVKRAFGSDDAATLAHFVNYGMTEGRQGISAFDVKSYKNLYPDLRKAYGNHLKSYYLHYVQYGKKEGRVATGYANTLIGATTIYNGVDYSPVYDFNYYVKNNIDVLKAYGYDENAVLAHFVNYGMNEGRIAKNTFNVHRYKARYADLQNAYGNNLRNYYTHYIFYGIKENRKAI